MFCKTLPSGSSLTLALVLILLMSSITRADDDCFEFCEDQSGGFLHVGGDEDGDYWCCLPGPPPAYEARKCTADDPAGSYQCSKFAILVVGNHGARCTTEDKTQQLTRTCIDKEYQGPVYACGCVGAEGPCLCLPVLIGPDGLPFPQATVRTQSCGDCF